MHVTIIHITGTNNSIADAISRFHMDRFRSLARDIGVETFILALRQFASRRVIPATMISNNAKTLSLRYIKSEMMDY